MNGRRSSSVLAAFFAAGLACISLAALVAIVDALTTDWRWHWLALHLVLLGGVSQLVLGAGQFFASAFLATDPPGRRLVAAQLAAWNGGTVLVVTGVTGGWPILAEAGAALVITGLVLFALALRGMQRRALRRARWALRWYQAATWSLALGAMIGALLAHGTPWTHGSLLGAHLALNLAGWLGAAIVGTLHTFYPSLTQTKLRFERLQGPTFVIWFLGVAELAIGWAFSAGPLVIGGWADLAVAAAMLAANVVASARAAARPMSLPARLVGVAQAFLLAGVTLALVTVATGDPTAPPTGPERRALAALLIAGWIGLTVAGSLIHLLAILGRVRDLRRPMPAPDPPRDQAIAAVAALAVLLVAASEASGLGFVRRPAAVVLVLVAGALAARVARLAARAARRPRRTAL